MLLWIAGCALIVSLIIIIVDQFRNLNHARTEEQVPTYLNYARGLSFLLIIYLAIRLYGINVLLILVTLTAACILVWGGYRLYQLALAKNRGDNDPLLVDYARSLLPIFIIVLVIRSFLFQPFRVPSGSLEPTVEPGDFVLVSQFDYGLRLPVIHYKILDLGKPKRGDIAVFHYPVDPNVDFIKRIIGLPGDHIQYQDKQLTINGHKVSQKFIKQTVDMQGGQTIPAVIKQEDLPGKQHQIMLYKHTQSKASFDFTVPQGYYFVMGDNRDGSADSRYWGFVPDYDLVGRAWYVWFHWGANGIIWSRFGQSL